MWSKCSDRFHGVSGSWHVTKVTLGIPELRAHTGKPVDTPKLAAQKKKGLWRGYQESVCNWKLQENIFSSFQIHRILPKREQNFFFFFEMCNCVKLLWFQIYTEIWNHLVFIQTNSNWRTSSLSWEHICTKKPTFPNSLTYKRLGPVELTDCAEVHDMLCHLFHFIPGWLLAYTVLGMRWEIKKKKKNFHDVYSVLLKSYFGFLRSLVPNWGWMNV